MRFYIFKQRTMQPTKPWIVFSAHRAAAFATWAEAIDYADDNTPAEATA